MSVALTGNDTIQIGGRVFSDLGDGDVAELKFDNDLVEVVNGKNDNAIFAINAKGKQGSITVKVLRGSPDDIFLNLQYNIMAQDFASYVLMAGNFTKRIGSGRGTVSDDRYFASGGVVGKIPDANSSSDGKTDDAQVTWMVKFATMQRAA